ncbi:MAG: SCO family protein [Pseudomonadota bacterium]
MRLTAAILVALATTSASAFEGLPFNLGGSYALTNQHGDVRTEADPEGNYQLLFFGYANCLQICSAALPMMGDIAADIAEVGTVVPVMITVDPETDTPEYLNTLTQYHDSFIGLTGTEDELQVAYDAFSVEKELLFVDPTGYPVYSHGSFLYLLDGNGEVLTLVPPILDVDQAVALITPYLEGQEG